MSHQSEIVFSLLLFGFILSVYATGMNVRNHTNWPKDMEQLCGVSYDADRIIGGSDASIGQYPWQARIGYESNLFCFQMFTIKKTK